MRKSGIFILGLLSYANVGLFAAPAHADRADPILDMCLEYLSCVASHSYYGLAPQDVAKSTCDVMYPRFVELLNQEDSRCLEAYTTYGWKLGEAHKFDLESYHSGMDMTAAEWEEYSAEAAVASAIHTCQETYGTRGKTLPLMETEYYGERLIKDDGDRRLYMVAPLATCPDGGLSGSFDIRSCHVDAFTDTSGSGVYNDACYYTK